jgi:hypothetical protein
MRRQALLIVAVVVAVVVAYASSVTAGFVSFDDDLYVTSNSLVQDRGIAGLLALWNPRDALDGTFVEFFPLRDSVYWLVWQLFGRAPAAFHAVNLVFHVAVSLLVGRLALRLGLSSWAAAMASLLFAVHPGHIESVVWIAGLKDPMFATFLLGALVAYARFIDGDGRGFYVGALALLVLSLLCKSLGFIAPGLLLLIEQLRGRGPWPLRLLRLVPFAVVCLGAVAFFVVVGHANGVIIPPHGGSWRDHTVLALWAFSRYVQQAVIPWDFQLLRCAADPDGWWDHRFFIGLFAVVAFGVALWRARRHRLAFFLLAWFPIALFPVMNILPFPALIADRYLYVPGIAVIFAIALALERLPERLRRPATAATLATLALVTALRGSLWHDEALLWLDVAEDPACQNTPRPELRIADALIDKDPRRALEHFHASMNKAAFAGLPSTTRCGAHATAAGAALAIDDVNLAVRHIEAAIAICPTDPFIWDRASETFSRSGALDRELDAAERAVALSSTPRTSDRGRSNGRTLPGMVWNRGLTRFRAGQVDGAAADFAAAIAEDHDLCGRYQAWRADTAADARAPVEAVVGDACR